MSLRSKMSEGKSVRGMFPLVALAAGLAVSAPDQVHAGGPRSNPFTGHYGCTDEQPYLDITISRTGRIRGSLDYWTDISGAIREDGSMEITTETLLISFDPTRGKRWGKYTRTAVGLGALDEFGNLYVVLEWNNGGTPTVFFWPRCE